MQKQSEKGMKKNQSQTNMQHSNTGKMGLSETKEIKKQKISQRNNGCNFHNFDGKNQSAYPKLPISSVG